jgi:hypothetical protein
MRRNVTRTVGQEEVLTDVIRESPVDQVQYRLRRWLLIIPLLVLVALIVCIVWLIWRFSIDRPMSYDDIREHFKYGSIGAEPGGSLLNAVGGLVPPYWIFRALPKICPEMLPHDGLAGVGLIFEEGVDRPIGMSRRYRLGVDFAGFNCAVCHTGTYRATPQSPRQIVLGMPSHQLDFQALTRFIINCPLDDRFTPDNVLAKIREVGGKLDWLDRLIYRYQLIPRVRNQTLDLGRRVQLLLDQHVVTPWGRGRVDTFNPYKSLQFHWNLALLPNDELVSASDFPSLWNQKPRQGMQLHWDGNNDSVDERNLSASLGAGVTPVTIDHERLKRVADWAWTLPPPAYPFPINRERAAQGAALYAEHCTLCHADHTFRDGHIQSTAQGTKVGHVVRLKDIGTDPHRWLSYTYTFVVNQYTLYPDSRYRFTHFRKTDGYANHPLDGIWARAPYLHNGSVPTLRDLLEAPDKRPKVFYRGYDVFDQEKVGFVSNVAEDKGVTYSLYNTTLPGNSNSGHNYALDLPAADKDAIVEYLKTF